MSVTKAASRGVPVTLQSAAVTGNGTAIAVPPSFTRHTFLIKGSAGISAGKVKCEAASAPDYAGTWALLGTEVTAVASTELLVVVEGIYQFVRARISTDIVDGTIDVTYVGGSD